MIAGGWHSASSDPVQIQEWKALRPTGWAVACAPSGLVVLDVDPRNGGPETLKQYPPRPRTLRALTPSGGWHEYYRAPEGISFRNLGPGVEMKHRGYVLLPGSTHPGGGLYAWAPGPKEIVYPPDWLVEATARVQIEQAPDEALCSAEETVLAGLFESKGWLLRVIDHERVAVVCPWADWHSGRGTDSGTVVFQATESHPLGRFWCSHESHGRKGVQDVLEVL